ncbi:hypothetical protein QF049_005814 [Paenibacillus sp. W4I10]|uniref:Uncharacterized protein n=1 Tax=Paenibacillus xylanexedens TaxID=528191 RepID=A0ABS4RTY4_PAEXY|nr:hypothetical protein [Paenibacillus xylanexedens]MCP1422848.1 hypothetical protein [Paenibacillus xylanexedens]MDQ0724553.1 hypothetical protein [Paenibacillus sp. W4I10]MDR6719721.1 hypothetical protein [Paenibacillus sp. 2003]RPK23346.1 hypothetical protein EDO6_05687 [Paenibacillus xylanexedens]
MNGKRRVRNRGCSTKGCNIFRNRLRRFKPAEDLQDVWF